MNSRGSPERILAGHAGDEVSVFAVDFRPAPVTSADSAPIQTKAGSVPPHDSFRLHDEQGASPLRPATRQQRPEDPIAAFQLNASVAEASLENDDLVTQGYDLAF